MSEKVLKIALVGNPNTGKTSLFNLLTGLRQKVGNYPGITVDKKSGTFYLEDRTKIRLIDLPGTYSLNPGSLDEEVVLETLSNKDNPEYPDGVLFVADSTNLKRNLYFFSQITDLNIPSILCLNMSDLTKRKGIEINKEGLAEELECDVLKINARNGDGIEEIKNSLKNLTPRKIKKAVNVEDINKDYITDVKKELKEKDSFVAWVRSVQSPLPSFLSKEEKKIIRSYHKKHKVKPEKLKIKETIKRYQFVNALISKFVKHHKLADKSFTGKLDRVLTHKVFGYGIFFTIMLLLFQAIYSWSSIPMDYIDLLFTQASELIKNNMSPGPLRDLISQGIIPGISGVVIFIPQIAILFAFVSVLEDSGYMSRVVFIMDKIMRKFGLGGKSIVPLMSGMACAVPAIMSTRTINNWKERLITILITPFITCSARLPVYSIIIALVIPDRVVFGFFNLQGLTLMLMYLIGFVFAILIGYLSSKVIKVKEKSIFIIEMPSYKMPHARNILAEIYDKTKSFVFDAGKIIFTLSIILWFLASYGPGEIMEKDEFAIENPNVSTENINKVYGSYKIEHSYIGKIGKFIEPAIKPIGYDWKIGIALISSLAAREVFVGTMATIYAVGSNDDSSEGILKRMQGEINPITGKPKYDLAVGWSLLLFYAFAMQCVSTIAVVKRETKSWKWPIIQTVFMTSLAYLASFLIYTVLS